MISKAVRLFFFVAFVVAKPFVPFVSAHHGGGSFDLSKSITYNGVLTKVELVNPHSWLYFDVIGADGKVSHHRCEMRSVHVLRRSGWSKEQFPAGKAIIVEAAPLPEPPAAAGGALAFPEVADLHPGPSECAVE